MKEKVFTLILVLVFCVSFFLSGCSIAKAPSDLMQGITPNKLTTVTDLSGDTEDITDFGVRLFQNSLTDGGNTLVSPLSVLCALAMTANGADGETLSQMEETFCVSSAALNNWLYAYMSSLPDSEKCKLSLANSIWFSENSGFTANPEFLQYNADYYGAELYRVTFDQAACNRINSWVKKHTDGMIEKILEQPPEAVMCLINALAFDAEWQNVYREHSVRDNTFTTEKGEQHTAEFMHSRERAYLEDENAVGFIKYYCGNDFAFVALLPDEDISVSDYVASLSGKKLQTLLSNIQNIPVDAAIPKFTSEYSAEMSSILKNMGITDAFDMDVANFSRLGSSSEGPLYITQILHKTFIQVDERGTKAGAATAVSAGAGAAPNPEEPKSIILDRPFLYLLIDCKNNIPFFIGSIMDVEQSSSLVSPVPVTSTPENLKFRAQYVRTDGYHEGVEYPILSLIRSVEELDAYYEQNKSLYFMERREKTSSGSNIGFLDACDCYDEAFFKNQALVLVLLEEGSGSIRHKVTEVLSQPDGTFTLNIQTITPEVGTCDMAEWHIFVELPADELPSSPGDVEIVFT